ncbi:DUF6913 domain-containing protein [Flagellimonas zhangzhouensis]|uniref:Uncharacterized protein n=1 Tax=Flagellimonas zhangzhouensis TaxID=1073328 RepID=A0A1H2S012_9FLAO|nr:hypothetical protein [Allomuricauda zhangzhouensis]SDQ69245.1 hypothetical protein SAMN05216294_2220 [Allomuricauda zhangzhouensis]SDW25016.1 hypothetical protein SAMN04487892_0867 [Allomuricauda zhangzhouensis]
MFIRGLQDKFKVKSGQKYLQEELDKPSKPVARKKGISSIGCIVDVDSFKNAEAFYELIEEFSLRPNAIKIIGYKKEYDKNSPYAIQIFSDKDLGWKGQIENGYVLEFLGREYDMLINYYEEDSLMMKLLSVQSAARLKVGLGSQDPKLNDLILNTPLNDFKLFKSELKKYLKVLNEI